MNRRRRQPEDPAVDPVEDDRTPEPPPPGWFRLGVVGGLITIALKLVDLLEKAVELLGRRAE